MCWGAIPPFGWYTAEELRRRIMPRCPAMPFRHALKLLVDQGEIETRIEAVDDGGVREYRAKR